MELNLPEDADLVVVGNRTNPTSKLYTCRQLLALRQPGWILVVDEVFADSVPGEGGVAGWRFAARRAGTAQPDQDMVVGGIADGL